MTTLTPKPTYIPIDAEKRWFIANLLYLVPLAIMMSVHIFNIEVSQDIRDVIVWVSLITLPMALYEDALYGIECYRKQHLKVEEPFSKYVPYVHPVSVGRKRKGYVYLLAVKNSPGLYKIGRASNPDNRLRTFNVKLPFPVEYEHLIKSDDMYALESALHWRFREKRQEGEFFNLSRIDVESIKTQYE